MLTFTYHEIVKEQGLIELILLLSDFNVDNPVVSLKCPPNVTPILPEHIIGVYTDMEYMQKQADEKAIKRAIKQAKKKFKRKLEKLEIQAEAKQKEIAELREKLKIQAAELQEKLEIQAAELQEKLEIQAAELREKLEIQSKVVLHIE